MRTIVHCRLSDVPLSAILHALSDPKRLALMARLAGAAQPIETKDLCGDLSASSVHDHLAVLRQAGLIRTVKVGASLAHNSRIAEHEDDYRAAISAILVADASISLDQLPRRRAEALWEEMAQPKL